MASAADDFDRADGDIGANWTVITGNFDVATNTAVQRTNVGAHYGARYTGTTNATNDYYSEASLRSATGGAVGAGVAVRMQVALTYYGYTYYGGDNAYLSEITAGVETILDTGSAVTAATDYTARLTVAGTSLTGTRGGSADVSATDATLSTGDWGIAAYNGETTGIATRWNSWLAADTGAATPIGLLVGGKLVHDGILQGRLVGR